MKVLFIIPKNRFSFFGYKDVSPLTFPHLGVAYLISVLKHNDIEVGLFDDGEGYPEPRLFEVIDEFRPDLIGITIFTLSSPFAYSLVEQIKKRNSDIPIVLGGVHVSTVKRAILEETKADFAIKYEGEYALLELLNELKKDSPQLSRVHNLIWRENGNIVENSDLSFIERLDGLPFPDFSFFNIKQHPSFKAKILPMVTTRGCPFECNFCSVNLYMGRRFRVRSPQNVFAEIKHHYDKGFRQFDINDDCFTVDRKRSEEILDMIIESKLNIKFRFASGLRVDTVDLGLLSKIKKAGCVYISYGCESGNKGILEGIKKGIELQEVRNAVRWTKEVGIQECSVNFIIGHKDETYETAMDSINFAKSLPSDYVNFYNLVPYPGTEAYDWAKKYGKFLVDTNNYLEAITYADNQPIFETKEFTRRERSEITAKGFRLHEYRIMRYRFGKLLGSLLFFFTRNKFIKKALARFATANKIGNRIAVFLSRCSYKRYSKNE